MRYDLLISKTLKTLHYGNVPQDAITIFVSSQEEKDIYLRTLREKGAKLLPNYDVTDFRIVVGVRGIGDQRNFIVRYFWNEGKENVVFMDDDVSKLEFYNSNTNCFRKITNIPEMIENGFNMCESRDIYLWGIYAVRNPMFIKQRPENEEGLFFIVGPFYGQRIRNPDVHSDILTTMKVKVDVENSILHYIKDGKVLRFNRYTLTTKYANSKGGIAENVGKDNLQRLHTQAAMILKEKYPKYGFMRRSKTYGMNFQLKLII
jgi:hypothetical protein